MSIEILFLIHNNLHSLLTCYSLLFIRFPKSNFLKPFHDPFVLLVFSTSNTLFGHENIFLYFLSFAPLKLQWFYDYLDVVMQCNISMKLNKPKKGKTLLILLWYFMDFKLNVLLIFS